MQMLQYSQPTKCVCSAQYIIYYNTTARIQGLRSAAAGAATLELKWVTAASLTPAYVCILGYLNGYKSCKPTCTAMYHQFTIELRELAVVPSTRLLL